MTGERKDRGIPQHSERGKEWDWVTGFTGSKGGLHDLAGQIRGWQEPTVQKQSQELQSSENNIEQEVLKETKSKRYQFLKLAQPATLPASL